MWCQGFAHLVDKGNVASDFEYTEDDEDDVLTKKLLANLLVWALTAYFSGSNVHFVKVSCTSNCVPCVFVWSIEQKHALCKRPFNSVLHFILYI